METRCGENRAIVVEELDESLGRLVWHIFDVSELADEWQNDVGRVPGEASFENVESHGTAIGDGQGWNIFPVFVDYDVRDNFVL